MNREMSMDILKAAFPVIPAKRQGGQCFGQDKTAETRHTRAKNANGTEELRRTSVIPQNRILFSFGFE